MAERIRPSRITVRELTTADDPAFDAAYALLRAEFPRAEMLPKSDWSNAMRERRARLWTDINWHLLVAERGGRTIAAATGMYLGNVNIGIVGYIAVQSSARALGLGPRMRRALRDRFEGDARHAGRETLAAILGEVRIDNPWLRTLVRREGAIALDFDYFQPSLGGTRKPVPLVLYFQPLSKSAPRTALGAQALRKLLYTMWRRAYRVSRPLSDPAFRRMMRSLEGRRRIGQRELPHVRRP